MHRLPPLALLLLLLAFFLSGAAGLVLQIVWTQSVSVFFGVSAHAIATTLAAFMGGLALGAWGGGRVLARERWSPLRLYALSELLVALGAVALQGLLTVSADQAAWLVTTLPMDGLAGYGLRFGILGGLMLVPTCAMGASFPFFVRALMRWDDRPLATISTAYGVNVLGAALGCIATASLLLSSLGSMRCALLAAGLNAIAMIIALWVDRVAGRPPAVPTPAADEPVFSPRVLEILVAVSGFSAMAFEVIWSRMYRQALWLVNPFQAFAQILALILVGMALGGLIVRVRALGRAGALRLFAAIQLLLVVLCFLGITQVRWGIGALLPMETTHAYRWVSAVALSLGALALGMGFPLLSSAHAAVREQLGRLYAFSAAGGLLGSLAGGFWLIPMLGVRKSLIALSAGFLVSGGLATMVRLGLDTRRAVVRGVGLVLAATGLSLVSAAVTEDRLDFACPDCEILWLSDGLEATTAVVETPSGARYLYTDGRAIMPGALPRRALSPFLLAPSVDRVLSIGFGSGQLAKLLVDNFPASQVESVELDGNMAQTAHLFGTEDVFRQPNFRFHEGDGRQRLLRSEGAYDLVFADTFTHSINTQIYGSGFFAAAREALAPDGSFFITVPLQDLPSTTEAEIILRTAAEVFPYVYVVVPDGMAALLARQTPLPEPLEVRVLPERLSRQLGFQLRPGDVYRLDETILATFESHRINSDDRPFFFPVMRQAAPGSGEAMHRRIRDWGGLR